MSFTSGASEIGTGIGAFINPIVGSNQTTSTTTTTKPSSSSTTIILVVVFFVIVGAIYLYTRKKTA